MSGATSVAERVHETYIRRQRGGVLSAHLAPLFAHGTSVLDVGCGDGLLTWRLSQLRPDLSLQGLEVSPRETTLLPVRSFDGRTFPIETAGVDAVLFVDTLHHAAEPMRLLREAVRVARQAIVIKDHACDGLLAGVTLRFMDRVSNRRFHVATPGTYWPKRRWFEVFEELGLRLTNWRQRLGLYPWPANYVFDRSLHFIARLDVH